MEVAIGDVLLGSLKATNDNNYRLHVQGEHVFNRNFNVANLLVVCVGEEQDFMTNLLEEEKFDVKVIEHDMISYGRSFEQICCLHCTILRMILRLTNMASRLKRLGVQDDQVEVYKNKIE